MGALPSTAIIGVIGAGTMGAGIAQVAAKAGHSVLLFDAAPGAAKLGIERTAKGLQKLVERNKYSALECEAILSRMTPCDKIEELAPAKLVVEAIVESLEVKRQVFLRLEALCHKDTILATNTSSISVTAIGAELARPENLVGMHFFNPAPVMKLVEVISGVATAPDVARQVVDTAYEWGKEPVFARSTPGFIVNRVARPFYAESLRVLQEGGANAPTIDAIVRESGGFRMGPFELMDLIGNDVNYAVTQSVFDAFFQDSRFKPSLVQQELVSAGYLGRKSGRGFYDYSEGIERPKPATAETQLKPAKVSVRGHLGVAESLVELANVCGIVVDRDYVHESPSIHLGDVYVALSDGRTATQVSAERDNSEVVLFDLCLDFESSQRIAVTPSDQCSELGLQKAIGFFQALGKQVSVIDDLPGMVMMRTVCMLANEGADAVNQQVCDEGAVDLAMQAGLNYPRGPLAWADDLGLSSVVSVLDNLAAGYGENRYRVSPLLRRKALARTAFFDSSQ